MHIALTNYNAVKCNFFPIRPNTTMNNAMHGMSTTTAMTTIQFEIYACCI